MAEATTIAETHINTRINRPLSIEAGRVNTQANRMVTKENHPMKVIAGKEIPSVQLQADVRDAMFSSRNAAGERVSTREQNLKRNQFQDYAVLYDTIRSGSEVDLNRFLLGGGTAPDFTQPRDPTTGEYPRMPIDARAIRGQMESILQQQPAMWARYSQLTNPVDQRSYLISIMKDSNFRAVLEPRLKKVFSENLNVEDKVGSLEVEIAALTTKRAELMGTSTLTPPVIGGRISSLTTQIETLEKELAEYKPITTTPVPNPSASPGYGQYARESSTLKKAIAGADASADLQIINIKRMGDEISKLEEEYRAASARVVSSTAAIATSEQARLDAMRTSLDGLRTRKETAEKAFVAAKKTAAENQVKSDATDSKEQALKDKIAAKKAELAASNEELARVNPELAKKRGELDQAVLDKASKEDAFLTSMESILVEGTAEVINKDLDRLVEAQLKVEEEAAKTAKDAREQRVRERMIGAFKDARGRVDWRQFDTNWEVFLRQGPDMALTTLANSAGSGTLLDFTAMKSDNPELYRQLVNDFKDKMGRYRLARPARFVDGLVGKKRQINEAEMFNIVDQFGAEYFNKALESSKDFASLKQQATEAGIYDAGSGGFLPEGLKKLPLNRLLSLIGLLLGGGLLHTVGIGGVIGGIGGAVGNGASFLAGP